MTRMTYKFNGVSYSKLLSLLTAIVSFLDESNQEHKFEFQYSPYFKYIPIGTPIVCNLQENKIVDLEGPDIYIDELPRCPICGSILVQANALNNNQYCLNVGCSTDMVTRIQHIFAKCGIFTDHSVLAKTCIGMLNSNTIYKLTDIQILSMYNYLNQCECSDDQLKLLDTLKVFILNTIPSRCLITIGLPEMYDDRILDLDNYFTTLNDMYTTFLDHNNYSYLMSICGMEVFNLIHMGFVINHNWVVKLLLIHKSVAKGVTC